MLCLIFSYGEESRRVPLPRKEALIGSSSACDIVLPFPGVSRRHARLTEQPHGWEIADLGSKNGLVVGGKRQERVSLTPGVPVLLGRSALTLLDGSTSDLEVALAADLPARTRRDSDSLSSDQSETTPRTALRLLREIDRMEESDRPQVLRTARRVLEAEALLIVTREGKGDLAIAALEGPLPEPEMLEKIAEAASRAKRRVQAVSIDDRPVIVRGSTRTGRLAAAAVLYARGAPEPVAWHVEMFEFLAERLLARGGKTAAPESTAMAEDRLVLPAAFVTGESPAMHGLLTQLRATLRSRMDVLLLGETGTGKELIARMIHDSGPASSGPFVPINCAAIPNELLEAELFGVQGRVATGVDPRPGLFVHADGGSIFLDEIGEMAQPLQAKLLRVLQSREVLALGATVAKKVNVQVISASNRDLLRAVQEGKFRADLYYRLRGLQFHIPPLRDRREDIPKLATAFVTRAAQEYEKHVQGVSRKALELLMAYEWPGNVRELENEVKRAVLVCPEGGLIGAEHFGTVRWAIEHPGAAVREETPAPAASPSRGPELDPPAPGPTPTLKERVEAVERAAIEDAMAKSGGNKSLAARLLGITRNGLALKLSRLSGGC